MKQTKDEILDIAYQNSLNLRHEFYPANNCYGNATILRKYSGRDEPIFGVIPHGISFGDLWKSDIENDFPILCWQQGGRAWDYFHVGKEIKLIAAPFLYADAMLNSNNIKRTGSVFFPAHSTEHVTAMQNHWEIADKLRDLPDRFHPITVCLYWKDVRLGITRFYEDFELNCAGGMFDPNFLMRMATILRSHNYLLSNFFGSHAFFGTAVGTKFIGLSQEFEYAGEDPVLVEETSQSQKSKTALGQINDWQKKLSEPSSSSIARQFLGGDYFLQPDQMKEFLDEL